jgi:hypothetical protein
LIFKDMDAASGKEISPQKVSNALLSLDMEQSLFKGKPIDDTVEFPFLEGISKKVREIGIEAHVFF